MGIERMGGIATCTRRGGYYGTVGSNRDEFIIVRKMAKIDWLNDEPQDEDAAQPAPSTTTVEAH